ncbi:hypothetical protein BX666DRAFT_2024230 [Dichotomocladium elegans]|nr:hypothetical protein BX666DRAFT_2024230 [Dichotomocladium elegans]
MHGGEGYFGLSATDQDVLWSPLPVFPNEAQTLRPLEQPEQLEEWFHPSRATTIHEEAPQTRRKRIIAFLHTHLSRRVVRRVLKCTIAYFLSTLVVLIKPVARALGRAPFLSAMGMVFSHPGRSMGAQFDTTAMACAGILLSIACSMAGRAVPKPFASIFLFFGALLTQLLRQRCPRFYYFSLQFMIVQIFSLTALTHEVMLPFDYGVPLLIGCGISLVVNLVIWPETAMDGLGRALEDTTVSCKEVLTTVSNQFLLDPSAEPVPQNVIDEQVERMRKNMAKVRGAYREAKYEISYTRIRPQDLREVRKILEVVTKHLGALSGSLRIERQLFGFDQHEEGIRRTKRKTDNQHVLYTYVEQLRDPLIRLSAECSNTLQYLADCFATSEPYNVLPPPSIQISLFDQDEKGRLNDLALREELFLVFFFIFLMRRIAKEIEAMKTIMAALNVKRKRRRFYVPKLTTLLWLRRWASSAGHQSTKDKGGYSHAVLEHLLDDKEERKRAGSILDLEISLTLRSREDSTVSKHPKVPIMMRARYALWKFLQLFKKYEFKFALKIAVAVTALCIPAFVPWKAEWFSNERCQWSSVTVVAIMNPTSGGTLQASLWRVVGTVIGTLVGWAALETGKGSAYVLAIFAVLLASAGPFFFIHLGSTYNKVGLVVLISYVIVALVHYAQPVSDSAIAATVWKRTTMVIIGILGDYYTFLVTTFLYHDLRIPPTAKDMKKGFKIETKIQDSIVAAGVLLDLTDHEPRLKGPFPKALYKEIIDSLQAILDILGCMRVTMIHMPVAVKRDITSKEVHVERRDMMAAIMLHFYAVSSTLNTKIPLPIYLPSMRAARMRLIQHRRESKQHWVKFRNMSWYAMSSCSEEIIDELEHLTRLVSCIVGDAAFADNVKQLSMPSL